MSRRRPGTPALAVWTLVALGTVAHADAAPETTDPRTLASPPGPAPAVPLAKLYATREMRDAVWSPDGRTIAFVTNTTGRSNLWTMPAEGGWSTQLTVSDQRQAEPAWSPDGKWIAYASDYDGNEQWDLFTVAPS